MPIPEPFADVVAVVVEVGFWLVLGYESAVTVVMLGSRLVRRAGRSAPVAPTAPEERYW